MRRFLRVRTDRVTDPRGSGAITAGIGNPAPYCDCSNADDNLVDTSNVLTMLVSAQFLVLVCAKYCKSSPLAPSKYSLEKRTSLTDLMAPKASSESDLLSLDDLSAKIVPQALISHNEVAASAPSTTLDLPTLFASSTESKQSSEETTESLFKKYLSTFSSIKPFGRSESYEDEDTQIGDKMENEVEISQEAMDENEVEEVEDVDSITEGSNRVKKSKGSKSSQGRRPSLSACLSAGAVPLTRAFHN